MSESEQIDTGSKKGRGRSQKTLDLIEAMEGICAAAQPITGRGVGYKLFTAGLITSMSEMPRVYRALVQAREEGTIPWEWIVDETRSLERAAQWDDPEEYTRCVIRGYRRNYWDQQAARVEVWSEKGTIRGVVQPILDEYGVGFRVMHGYASATAVNDIAADNDGRDLIALYVGDCDPSGMHMSEKDLPERLERYDGDHVVLNRIALIPEQLTGLPFFPAADKKKDKRYSWFVKNYGQRCWELDALDPNVLRECVEKNIRSELDMDAWERCKVTERAERDSLRGFLAGWAEACESGRSA